MTVVLFYAVEWLIYCSSSSSERKNAYTAQNQTVSSVYLTTNQHLAKFLLVPFFPTCKISLGLAFPPFPPPPKKNGGGVCPLDIKQSD